MPDIFELWEYDGEIGKAQSKFIIEDTNYDYVESEGERLAKLFTNTRYKIISSGIVFARWNYPEEFFNILPQHRKE